MRILLLLILLSVVVSPALAQDSVSPVVAQRMLRLIERYDQEPEQLLEAFDNLANSRGIRDNDRGFVRREQAALLIREERMDEARELLRETLEGEEPDYVPSLRILLAQLELMAGNSDAALPHLEIWSQYVTEPHPQELVLLGYAYLQLERFADASAVFERVIELSDIVNEQWYELLAYAYTQSGRTDDAIALLDQRIEVNPGDARWWRQLSNIYLLLEQYDAGAASLAIADVVTSLSYEESRRLAGLFSMLNMPADAAGIMASAFQRFPAQRSYEDQMLLGELWMLARELDRAIGAFEVAATLGEDGEAALKIGQLQLQWERYEEARDALRMAAEGYGEETPEQLWYLLGIIEINLDNLQAANEAIGRIDPDGDYGDRAANLDRFIQNRMAASSP